MVNSFQPRKRHGEVINNGTTRVPTVSNTSILRSTPYLRGAHKSTYMTKPTFRTRFLNTRAKLGQHFNRLYHKGKSYLSNEWRKLGRLYTGYKAANKIYKHPWFQQGLNYGKKAYYRWKMRRPIALGQRRWF